MNRTVRNISRNRLIKLSKTFMKTTYMTNTNASRIGAKIVIGLATMMAFIGIPFFAQAATLTRQLDIGMSGGDVTALQQFLAADPSIYPQGLVTGYYGTLTAAAVSNFQAKNGLANVGRVGPATLALINASALGGIGGSSDDSAPILQPEAVVAGRTSVTMNWNLNEPAFAHVMYGTYWPFLFDNAPSVSGLGGVSTYQTVTINDLNPNTTYYYVLQSTDPSGNVNQTVGKPFKTTN